MRNSKDPIKASASKSFPGRAHRPQVGSDVVLRNCPARDVKRSSLLDSPRGSDMAARPTEKQRRLVREIEFLVPLVGLDHRRFSSLPPGLRTPRLQMVKDKLIRGSVAFAYVYMDEHLNDLVCWRLARGEDGLEDSRRTLDSSEACDYSSRSLRKWRNW